MVYMFFKANTLQGSVIILAKKMPTQLWSILHNEKIMAKLEDYQEDT